MKKFPLLALAGALLAGLPAGAQTMKADYPIQPVPFTQVHFHDDFWAPKIEINRTVTIPYVLQKCREEGRIDNFLKAAGKLPADKYTEYPFDDTDIYKLIEGASYSLQVKPDKALEASVDSLIAIIAAAQEPDGYLYTFRTMKPAKMHDWIGEKRWEKDPELSHELYNCGHLYEAATAHYLATGKKNFLTIAIKNADLLVKDFSGGKLPYFPGHQVVEMGLAKMYRVTGKKAYLDLAKYFLDIRGDGRIKGAEYNQSEMPVVQQHQAVGHAVRAAYMYTGMADVAALTGNDGYIHAINDIWQDVVDHKLYLTGGIGATGNGEAFGAAYDLPNMSAYAETCASIANVYWNSRMFYLNGDAQYFDVLERILYNGLLSGVSLSGNKFFYPNPLASMGQHQRSAWFGCACCISNMTRFMPSIPGYVYAQQQNKIYVNLFVANTASIKLPATTVLLDQETGYPWKGDVKLTVRPEKSAVFALHVRIPGWARGKPAPGSLYAYLDDKLPAVRVTLNGKEVPVKTEKGFVVL
ncbi:MAG TPA: glycoside hydrolase family 127 protein, partial [Flavihumibacter sp.]|nr:glycoside hydrolase family 127 protein [Flavihumibacter sp.]